MKIGLMGFGHLGKAVAKGLLHLQEIADEGIYVSAHSETTLRVAQEQFGLQVCASNDELVRMVDVVILLLPPEVFRREKFSTDWSGKTVISMMAGVKLAELRGKLGGEPIRVMPNLGVAENRGMLCYTSTEDQQVVKLLNGLGEAMCVQETEVERFMAVASCGIGFAAYLLQSYAQAGECMGFSREKAMQMTKNVFAYALNAGDFHALTNAVVTKGGATEMGISSMAAEDVASAVARAVEAAYNKMK